MRNTRRSARTFAAMFLVSAIVVCIFAPKPGAAFTDPVFTPKTLNDSHGNIANEDDDITWAPVPEGSPYNGVRESKADDELKTYYDMVNNWLDIIQPDDPPYDVITKMANGDFENDQVKEVVTFGIGILVCAIIGILFLLIMPWVACCFCCCRLCDNCGGKKVHIERNNTRCRCCCFGISLLVVTIIMAGGIICLYLVNAHLTDSIDQLDERIADQLDDLEVFLNNTNDELRFVTFEGYKFISEVIKRDLDNIGVIVGIPLRDKFGDDGVYDTFDSLVAFHDRVEPTLTDFQKVNDSTFELQTDGGTLQTMLDDNSDDLTTAQGMAGCGTACQALDGSGLKMDVNFTSLPSIATQLADLQNVHDNNLEDTIQRGKESFDKIPERVKNETEDSVQEIKDQLDEYNEDINEYLADLDDVPKKALEPIGDLRDQMTDLSDETEDYDKYRWYVGLSLISIPAFVVFLQIVGLLLSFTYSPLTKPTERSCLSECGGVMLMAAAGLCFIFSFFLMLLTILLFLPGSFVHVMVCEPLMDPEYTAFSELIDEPGGLFGDKYLFGDVILQNGSIPLTVSGALESCRNGSTAYQALKLNTKFDLDEFMDYEDVIDIDDEMSQMTVDFLEINLLSADSRQLLEDFSDAVQIDYDSFQEELAKDTTTGDLSSIAQAIRDAASDASSSDPAKAALLTLADNVDDSSAFATDVAAKQADLLNTIDDLEVSTATIPTDIDDLIAEADTAENQIHTNGHTNLLEVTERVALRLTGIIVDFMDRTVRAVRTEVAKCTPVWNIWETVVHNTVCKDFVWTLNGYWFALGWVVFFMVPAIIFDVKLAKFLRRMKYDDEFDAPGSTSGGRKRDDYPGGSPPPPYASSNKITPHEPAGYNSNNRPLPRQPYDYNDNNMGYHW